MYFSKILEETKIVLIFGKEANRTWNIRKNYIFFNLLISEFFQIFWFIEYFKRLEIYGITRSII